MALLIKKVAPNFLHKDFYDYYAIDSKNIYIVLEDGYDFNTPAKFINKQIYLPFGFIKTYVDEYIFLDEDKDKIIITDSDRVIRLNINNLCYHIDDKKQTLRHAIKKINSDVYLPADFLTDTYNLNISYTKKYNLVIVDFKNRSYDQARIKRNSVIRYLPDKKSFIAQKISNDGFVRIYNHVYVVIKQ